MKKEKQGKKKLSSLTQQRRKGNQIVRVCVLHEMRENC